MQHFLPTRPLFRNWGRALRPKPRKGKSNMVISDKQREANLNNAQHSSGPKTPEGKAAIRFNALTYRCYLETMVTSQWLLKRVAESESRVYESIAFGEERFKMLAYVAKQRAQLERSFRTAIADMKQSQKERQARQPQPAQTPQPTKPASASASKATRPTPRPPDYVMSEGAEAHPVFCAPVTPETR